MTAHAFDATTELPGVLKSQYHTSLAMLREAIEQCPDDLWLDMRPKNAFWQVAYHSLFFAHLYVGQDEAAFTPWAEHQRDNQFEDAIAGTPDLPARCRSFRGRTPRIKCCATGRRSTG